jgi:hypothetical protein
MPLQLPNLDDLTWDDLTQEARTLIPAYAPEWTDFNPSDPGITLVELFAYHVEALLYRVNRIGRNHRDKFLQLVNGPDWNPSGDYEQDLVNALGQLRRRERAVTEDDYETITLEKMAQAIARVKCIAGRNLERGRAASAVTEAPGDISVIVISPEGGDPSPETLAKVREVLERVRLLGTRAHVVGPRFVPLRFRFQLILNRNGRASEVTSVAVERLRSYFNPLPSAGGPGWPFGRAVHLSDVYALLDRIPAVNYVRKVVDPATGRALDEVVVPPEEARRLRRNSAGEVDSVMLGPDELPSVEAGGDSFLVDWERSL